jgi:hypothetical protein
MRYRLAFVAAAAIGSPRPGWAQAAAPDVPYYKQDVQRDRFDLKKDGTDLKADRKELKSDRAALRKAVDAYAAARKKYGKDSPQAETAEASLDGAQIALHKALGDFRQYLWDSHKGRRDLVADVLAAKRDERNRARAAREARRDREEEQPGNR